MLDRGQHIFGATYLSPCDGTKPEAMQRRLEGLTATHDFNKFWEMMRREKGSTRPPLTPEQRAKKPPVVHPMVLIHPISGRKVLYANPGYAVRINELGEKESDELLPSCSSTRRRRSTTRPIAGRRATC